MVFEEFNKAASKQKVFMLFKQVFTDYEFDVYINKFFRYLK